jgi:DNA-directed RNA polymerase specialized sigma24 family protein
LEKAITKDILRDELFSGGKPAAELLYNRYGGMLFSYIQQFVPSRAEAENLLVNIFSRLASRLETAFDSSLSVYCWLQIEARKIILEHRGQETETGNVFPRASGPGEMKAYYFSLLEDASPEHRWVFRELFINGRQREELASEVNKDQAYIGDLLRECMLIIGKKLG